MYFRDKNLVFTTNSLKNNYTHNKFYINTLQNMFQYVFNQNHLSRLYTTKNKKGIINLKENFCSLVFFIKFACK